MSSVTVKPLVTVHAIKHQHRDNEETRIQMVQLGAVGVFVDIRLFRDDQATHHGIRITLPRLPEVIQALQRAQSEGLELARKAGA